MSTERATETHKEVVVQERTVKLPVEVRDASSISASFLVPTDAVRRLLVDVPRLEVISLLPGRTLCTLAGIEYRDNDLGTYNEVGVVFFVRARAERGLGGGVVDLVRGRASAYIHRLPVTTDFSCAAGREIWGFPKFVAEIRFREDGGRRSVTLDAEGEHVFTLGVDCRPGRRGYEETQLAAFSCLGGVPRRTRFVSSGEGVGFRLGGATLELGEHPLAEELRSLGLPRRALTCARVDHMRMRFQAPERV